MKIIQHFVMDLKDDSVDLKEYNDPNDLEHHVPG